jgi:glycosyltransferase involved in cell wall biosynthesis
VRDRIEHRVVRHYIAVSDMVRDRFAPLVTAPITVLRHTVALDRFDAARSQGARERVRSTLGISDTAPVLLCVSRLVAGKGLNDLLPLLQAALVRYPDARLLLAGDGDLRADLERRVAQAGLGDAVLFLGNRADVPDLMAASDVFVFPSNSEGFGMVALEAMAAGLPVAAYDLPPFGEFMVPGTTALLSPLGDAAALTASALALLTDPLRRKTMGAAGVAHVREHFPADSVARVFAEVYDTVVAEREHMEVL